MKRMKLNDDESDAYTPLNKNLTEKIEIDKQNFLRIQFHFNLPQLEINDIEITIDDLIFILKINNMEFFRDILYGPLRNINHKLSNNTLSVEAEKVYIGYWYHLFIRRSMEVKYCFDSMKFYSSTHGLGYEQQKPAERYNDYVYEYEQSAYNIELYINIPRYILLSDVEVKLENRKEIDIKVCKKLVFKGVLFKEALPEYKHELLDKPNRRIKIVFPKVKVFDSWDKIFANIEVGSENPVSEFNAFKILKSNTEIVKLIIKPNGIDGVTESMGEMFNLGKSTIRPVKLEYNGDPHFKYWIYYGLDKKQYYNSQASTLFGKQIYGDAVMFLARSDCSDFMSVSSGEYEYVFKNKRRNLIDFDSAGFL